MKKLLFCAVLLLLPSTVRAGFINGFDNGVGYTANSFTTFGNYTPIFSGTGGNTVQMTTTTVGPMGSSLFYNDKQDILQFTVQFTYQKSGDGDGFAFVIQNDARGASAIGGAGGNMGYGNLEGPPSGHIAIAPSAAILFNIWGGHQRGTELVTGGNIDFGYTPVSPIALETSAPVQVKLTYDGSTLTESLAQGSNIFSTSYTVDLSSKVGGNTAYVGFSGGAGGASSDQFISDFTYQSPVATPEPSAMLLMATGGPGLLGWVWLRRRQSCFS